MTGGLTWARTTDDGWVLTLRVHPGARRGEVVGVHGDAMKVRVAAPADAGRANDALVALLADRLGVARRDVRIVRGAASRDKSVAVPLAVDPSALLGG